MILAMPKRRLHLPSSRMTKLAKVDTTLDMSINQFTLFDIHVTFLTIWIYENYVVPLQRRARKSRQATKGVGLHKTTQSMGIRMPISVVKGNRRPHDPLQAAKFASEVGVVVRSQVPIFSHWKHYKKQIKLLNGFVAKLSVNSMSSIDIQLCLQQLSNGFNLHSHFCSWGWPLMTMMKQQKKHARVYYSLLSADTI
jgi:hypothetical protein